MEIWNHESFNIRSVESCTAADHKFHQGVAHTKVSIFALSNRVLLLLAADFRTPYFGVSIFALSNRVLLRRKSLN